MEGVLEKYFNDETKVAFDRLEYYCNRAVNKPNVDKAAVRQKLRGIINSRFHHKVFIYGKYVTEKDKNRKEREGKYTWGMLSAIEEQKNLHGLSFDAAITKLSRSATLDERRQITKNIATLKGYLDYLTYHVQQMQKPQNAINSKHLPNVTEPLSTVLFPLKLSDVMEESKYEYIMNLLVNMGYCQKETHIWKDETKGSMGFLSAMLKYLHKQGYYRDNKRLSNTQIQQVAQNTFGIEIGIDTVKKANPEKYDFNFIQPASHIN